jgi:hypothetical protein
MQKPDPEGISLARRVALLSRLTISCMSLNPAEAIASAWERADTRYQDGQDASTGLGRRAYANCRVAATPKIRTSDHRRGCR